MKRIICMTLCLVVYSAVIMGQNVKQLSFLFNQNEFELKYDQAGEAFVTTGNLDFTYLEDTALPALPYIAYNVAISRSLSYVNHTFTSSNILLGSNVVMAHNPEVLPTNVQAPSVVSAANSTYPNNVYPDTNVKYVGSNTCGDYTILTFLVCPFEYNVTTKKLYLKSQINMTVNLVNSGATPNMAPSYNSQVQREALKSMVVNKTEVEGTTGESDGQLRLQTGYEYVIVTSNQLKSAFQPLADWKNRKGIRAKVITVEDIISTYAGATKPEKIKRALADIDGLSYVLLGGDTNHVPTCMCYIGYYDKKHNYSPVDSYYACLETMNWDGNGNGIYGELGDQVNIVPTLNVSRAPVSSFENAQTFVNRIITYESAPDTTNWKDNILMAGASLGFNIKVGKDTVHKDFFFYDYTLKDSISDSQYWSQLLYNQYISPYWNGERIRLFDTYSDISGDGSYTMTTSHLQTELGKGYTFADIMTHGGYYAWRTGTVNHSDYSWTSANILNNSGYTVIMTTACLTNAFDFDTIYHNHGLWCLSQHFIQNPNSGILAYWGTSRENWYVTKSSVLGGGAVFEGITYQKLFEDRYNRLGRATTNAKLQKMSLSMDSTTNNRWIWMSLNLMGDPEMPIYLSKPKVFQNVDVQFVNDSIYINAGVDDYDLCLINKADSTDYYIARNINTPSSAFPRLNGAFNLCLSKPGYIPYTSECGDIIYIQNKTLTSTNNFIAGKAYIGSNVTNSISQGPASIENGNTTIRTTRGTTITKDFEVKLGADLQITN